MPTLDLLGSKKTGLTLVLLSLGLFGLASLREPETVVKAVVRRQLHALPPYVLSTDSDRFLGLVLEPLCPPPPDQRLLRTPVRAVASCTEPDPTDGSVTARLRPGLRLHRKALTSAEVVPLLEAWAERAKGIDLPIPWETIRVEGAASVRFIPSRPADGANMRLRLAEVVIVDQDGTCRRGTGAWREVACLPDGTSPSESPHWKEVPPALRDIGAVTDLAVLERRSGLLGRKRILVIGLDYNAIAVEPAGESPTDVERSQALAGAVFDALGATTGAPLHLLRGFEGDQVQRIEALRVESSGHTWELFNRTGSRTAWAVANPGLDEVNRRWLLNEVRRAVNNPAWFDGYGGPSVRSLLPSVYTPVHFVPPPADLAWPDSWPETIPRTLLTHTFWEPLARRVHGLSDLRHHVPLQINPTSSEATFRNAGKYALSILTVEALDRSHPTRTLENLLVWLPRAEHKALHREADRLMAQDAEGQLDRQAFERLLTSLDAYIVPLSSPPIYFAVHQDLQGWDAYAERLDPDDVRLRSRWFRNAEWWSYGLFGLGLLALVTTWRVRQDRRERAAAVQRQVDGFHHDLTSPLSAIRAEADHLLTQRGLSDPIAEVARTVDLEAQKAIQLVDDMKVWVDPNAALRMERTLQTRLWAQGMEPELQHLRARATADGVDLRLDLPASGTEIEAAIGPSTCRRLIQNLLDNAYKFRKPGNPVEIRVRLNQTKGYAVLVFEDRGIGFDQDRASSSYFEGGVRGQRALDAGISGQGIGLRIVKDLVEGVGGEVALLQSQDPTRIEVRLPLALPKEQP